MCVCVIYVICVYMYCMNKINILETRYYYCGDDVSIKTIRSAVPFCFLKILSIRCIECLLLLYSSIKYEEKLNETAYNWIPSNSFIPVIMYICTQDRCHSNIYKPTTHGSSQLPSLAIKLTFPPKMGKGVSKATRNWLLPVSESPASFFFSVGGKTVYNSPPYFSDTSCVDLTFFELYPLLHCK